MGKALSGELSSTGTGLVFLVTTNSQNPGPSFKMDLDFWNCLEWNLPALTVEVLKTGLTLKAPITTAADDIHEYFFNVFQRK